MWFQTKYLLTTNLSHHNQKISLGHNKNWILKINYAALVHEPVELCKSRLSVWFHSVSRVTGSFDILICRVFQCSLTLQLQFDSTLSLTSFCLIIRLSAWSVICSFALSRSAFLFVSIPYFLHVSKQDSFGDFLVWRVLWIVPEIRR